ncbi:hypothetical protein [Paenibacillus taichungensis]|nr:hypothetical protein [Paenibacillus taichungensis]
MIDIQPMTAGEPDQSSRGSQGLLARCCLVRCLMLPVSAFKAGIAA